MLLWNSDWTMKTSFNFVCNCSTTVQSWWACCWDSDCWAVLWGHLMAMISPSLQFCPALHPDSLNPQTAVSKVLSPTEITEIRLWHIFFLILLSDFFVSFPLIKLLQPANRVVQTRRSLESSVVVMDEPRGVQTRPGKSLCPLSWILLTHWNYSLQ